MFVTRKAFLYLWMFRPWARAFRPWAAAALWERAVKYLWRMVNSAVVLWALGEERPCQLVVLL